jgi:hypothetical protein
MHTNIFTSLQTYGSAEPENYLTESLVLVLRFLLERSLDEGLEIINRIVGPLPLHRLTVASQVAIRTQVQFGNGCLDIEIRESDDTLVYVEIKHDSQLGSGQLICYRDHLEQSSKSNRRLVLVTRSRSSAFETPLKSPGDYRHVCWYHIYNWLADLHLEDQVCRHTVSDFLCFLEEKSMNLKRVTWEYEKGTEALLALVNMMEAAAMEVLAGVKVTHSGGWSWRGMYLDKVWFFGVRFEKPMQVVFENNMGRVPYEGRTLDLDKERFLALTKDEQFDLVADFIKVSSSAVPKVGFYALPARESADESTGPGALG